MKFAIINLPLIEKKIKKNEYTSIFSNFPADSTKTAKVFLNGSFNVVVFLNDVI